MPWKKWKKRSCGSVFGLKANFEKLWNHRQGPVKIDVIYLFIYLLLIYQFIYYLINLLISISF
jgi:hypothetical protein